MIPGVNRSGERVLFDYDTKNNVMKGGIYLSIYLYLYTIMMGMLL